MTGKVGLGNSQLARDAENADAGVLSDEIELPSTQHWQPIHLEPKNGAEKEQHRTPTRLNDDYIDNAPCMVVFMP